MEDWTGMNAIDTVRCKQNRLKCLSTVLAAKAADSWSQIVESCRPSGSHNGHMDALRHAYWFADLTARQDTSWAKAWGDAHENYPDNDPLEKAMDLHNSAVGRSVGLLYSSETERKAALRAKRDSGLLLKLVKVTAGSLFMLSGLLVMHVRSVVVEVTNRTSQPVDSVALHLATQEFLIGPLAVGETRRTRLWPPHSAGIALSHASPFGTRHASLGYLNPWHGLWDGKLLAQIGRDSVTIRQRADRRTLVPQWREYSVPLQEGVP